MSLRGRVYRWTRAPHPSAWAYLWPSLRGTVGGRKATWRLAYDRLLQIIEGDA